MVEFFHQEDPAGTEVDLSNIRHSTTSSLAIGYWLLAIREALPSTYEVASANPSRRQVGLAENHSLHHLVGHSPIAFTN